MARMMDISSKGEITVISQPDRFRGCWTMLQIGQGDVRTRKIYHTAPFEAQLQPMESGCRDRYQLLATATGAFLFGYSGHLFARPTKRLADGI
jgi:hypothetical protein